MSFVTRWTTLLVHTFCHPLWELSLSGLVILGLLVVCVNVCIAWNRTLHRLNRLLTKSLFIVWHQFYEPSLDLVFVSAEAIPRIWFCPSYTYCSGVRNITGVIGGKSRGFLHIYITLLKLMKNRQTDT